MTVIHATSVSSTNRARVSSEQSDAQQNGGYAIVRPSVSPGRHAGVCRLLQYRRCGWQGQALQGEWRGGGLGRSEIDCLDGVHEVGNRLLLNECVGKVFSSYSGGVYSLNITGQNYPIMEVVPPTPTNISLFFLFLWTVFGSRLVNPKLDTRISVRPSVRPSRSGDPPWILKRGGLESSGTNSGKSAVVVWKNLP